MKTNYERTISADEAKKRYFLVLKNKLSFFHGVGAPFSVKVGAQKKKAVVESYRCECQGPDQPHEHYFVRWNGLAQGDRLIVKKTSEKEHLYSIRIEE